MAQIDRERSSALLQALHSLYGGPQWALFYEVADTTGHSATRSADAVAMNMFPSRGCEIHGFEVKMRRGDWLNELKKPEKAERISSYCDFWWLVTGSDDVARLEELPAPWGWYSYDGKDLQVRKKPKKLKAMPLDRGFVAAMLRRSAEMYDRQRQAAAQGLWATPEAKKFQRDTEARLKRHFEVDIELSKKEKAALERQIAEFREKSGIEINAWNGGRMGEAVNLVSKISMSSDLDSLIRAARDLETRVQEIRRGADDLKQVATTIFGSGKLTV